MGSCNEASTRDPILQVTSASYVVSLGFVEPTTAPPVARVSMAEAFPSSHPDELGGTIVGRASPTAGAASNSIHTEELLQWCHTLHAQQRKPQLQPPSSGTAPPHFSPSLDFPTRSASRVVVYETAAAMPSEPVALTSHELRSSSSTAAVTVAEPTPCAVPLTWLSHDWQAYLEATSLAESTLNATRYSTSDAHGVTGIFPNSSSLHVDTGDVDMRHRVTLNAGAPPSCGSGAAPPANASSGAKAVPLYVHLSECSGGVDNRCNTNGDPTMVAPSFLARRHVICCYSTPSSPLGELHWPPMHRRSASPPTASSDSPLQCQMSLVFSIAVESSAYQWTIDTLTSLSSSGRGGEGDEVVTELSAVCCSVSVMLRRLACSAE